MAADRAHRGMEKESNIADGKRGDLADFLVTEVALELEVDHFALVGRQRLQHVVNSGERLPHVVPLVEVAGDGELMVVEGRHANRLLSRIQRQVAAHREEPRREMSVEPCRILPAQAKEGLLHDVAGRFQVAEEPLRVADQRPLVKPQCFGHEVGFRRPAHSVSMEDNDRAGDFLDRHQNAAKCRTFAWTPAVRGGAGRDYVSSPQRPPRGEARSASRRPTSRLAHDRSGSSAGS